MSRRLNELHLYCCCCSLSNTHSHSHALTTSGSVCERECVCVHLSLFPEVWLYRVPAQTQVPPFFSSDENHRRCLINFSIFLFSPPPHPEPNTTAAPPPPNWTSKILPLVFTFFFSYLTSNSFAIRITNDSANIPTKPKTNFILLYFLLLF